MKIVTSNMPPYFTDAEAPTLEPEPYDDHGRPLWRVWCDYCDRWHYHGPAPGHGIAHCRDPFSPYNLLGYNLSRLGGWDN